MDELDTEADVATRFRPFAGALTFRLSSFAFIF